MHVWDTPVTWIDMQYAIKHTFGGLLVAAGSSTRLASKCVI
jgi:hypothetical protein